MRRSLLLSVTAFVPTIWAQANTSYANYSSQSQPDLTPQTVATIRLAFPDCENGPLSTNIVCNATADYKARAAGLISSLTLEELINLTGNTQYGVPRLGLPAYQVWNEALHGLDRADFTDSGDYEWATSFPMPILSMASMNRTLINQIASIISTQARAFNNDGRYGLDSYAPNINGFRSPIWGRGQETPGEDAFFLSSAYAYEYITGLQGGVNPAQLKIVATPKHYAGYDLENWHNISRLGNDLYISQQDLAGYYSPQFVAAVSYAKAQSLMCSYNAVNGVPSCANSFFLQTLLRETWGFDADSGYVSTDCDAAYNVFNPHMYAPNTSAAAADSLLAGADIDCGTSYQYYLNESILEGLVSRDDIEVGVSRLYTQLVRLGQFDGNNSAYRQLTWDDVVKTDALNISYEAAVEGITLLKNDGTLPLPSSVKSVALIGPWANATTQLQGNYFGTPPYLISPLAAAEASGLTINYAIGTEIDTNSTANFSAALSAAQKSDAIVFAGGIDNTIEAEGQDRENVTWPGNQLDLISQLSKVGKPLVVLQMGGGQVDSSSLKSNPNVNSLVWGGYPGQSGGQAILDILTGKRAPAGRLVSTQYPAEYALQFPQNDLGLRPNETDGNPGQTYIWYTGKPVYAFGDGLFYTTFSTSAVSSGNFTNGSSYDIASIVSQAHPDYEYLEQQPLVNFSVNVGNTGKVTSDYSAMLFASTKNAGPAPYPNKWLVGFDRVGPISAGQSTTLTISVPIGAMARTDENGSSVLYPGTYKLALNNDESVVTQVTFTGDAAVLTKWPTVTEEIQPGT
ncbi:MAG: hypothetical protein M1821_006632 [Bathelium mastoideum]|nr:MAG: hypothetical protein M1821_006632 [Bathelium mastoideum]